MQELVTMIVRSLVDEPERVVVNKIGGERSIIFEVQAVPDDLGKMTGQGGRIANALRALIRAAGAREHRSIWVKLKSAPSIAPKSDETLLRLIHEAVEGKVQVYLAILPLTRCVPFDTDYSPEVHPAIAALTEARAKQLAEKPPSLLVYPRGDSFVVSDDYPTLFAYLRTEWTYVAAVVLGKPEGGGVEIVRGPLSPEEAKEAIFGEMVQE